MKSSFTPWRDAALARFLQGPSGILAAASLVFIAMPAAGQENFPMRPVQIIVPTGPGGGTDTAARLIARSLTERLKWQVVVINRLGAGTRLAGESVAKAPPDGHTLLMGINALATGPLVYKSMPYDALRDFAPITLAVVVPYIFVVHPSLPVKSAKDLIALARSRPGEISYASAGTGASNHLSMELLASMAQIRLNHVPYKFGIQGVVDVMAGHVATMMTTMASTIPQVRSGKLRALAVTSLRRDAAAPDIPALAETLPGYEVLFWTGLLGPAAMSRDIVTRLQRETAAILHDPQNAKLLTADGGQAIGSSPEEFAAFIKADTDKWAKLGRTIRITQE
jgi:tripartite-type tricarboxylate transporter receptor subunit TctC